MTAIIKATENDFEPIVNIGRVSVEEAHRDSCPVKDMSEYIESHYNNEAIKEELSDANNIYHIINYNDNPIGFSKIVLNAEHPNIVLKNVAKLDRIYLLPEFQGRKFGLELLKFNIDLSKRNDQSGIWLFTWVGNIKAIDFYLKNGFSIIGSDQFKVSETHYNPQYQMFLNFASFLNAM
jgi:diamine N-acetyltransferase